MLLYVGERRFKQAAEFPTYGMALGLGNDGGGSLMQHPFSSPRATWMEPRASSSCKTILVHKSTHPPPFRRDPSLQAVALPGANLVRRKGYLLR